MNIVAVKYLKNGAPLDREYTYYAEEELVVGQEIDVPVKGAITRAVVSRVGMTIDDVPPYVREFLKTIPTQAGREAAEQARLEAEQAGEKAEAPRRDSLEDVV